MRIAFLACNRNQERFRQDPSYIYRCENLAGGLRRLGHEVLLVHLGQLPRRTGFDVAVFHRPRYSWRLQAVMRSLARQGTKLVADVDDLVFDETLAEYSPGVVNDLVSLGKTRRMFAAHRAALARFDLITVATDPLAEQVRRCFPNAQCAVVPNSVHHAWRELDILPVPVDEREPVLTYSPGTRSHDRDFACVSDALRRLLDRDPAVRLEVTGPLRFSLGEYTGRVIHREKVPFGEFYRRVRTGWVNLAPLEQTPFTRCKSALKVIEAGFWGIPTVSSPTPDALRFAGAGALIADGAEEWLSVFERLLADRSFYSEQVAGLRERVLERADVYRVAREWLSLVMDVSYPAEAKAN